MDRALCPMFVVDLDGVIRRTNRRAGRVLRCRKLELKGRHLNDVLHLSGGRRATRGGEDGALIRTLTTRPRQGVLQPSFGDPISVSVSLQAIDGCDGDRFLIVARENTTPCGVVANAGAYLRDIAEAQERERQRIARELHDEALQSLLVAGIEVERLMQGTKSEQGLPVESLINLRTLLKQVENDVRQISGRMRSDRVPQCGLLDAVGNAVQTLQERGLDAQIRFRGAPVPVDPNIQILMYRIVQEALHNTWRHAHARRVRATVTCRDGVLAVRVTDNGAGFVVPGDFMSRGPTDYLGLKGMYERAALMNAKLSIASRPSRGTTVALRVPIVSSA